MKNEIFNVLNILDKNGIHYIIGRYRQDAITVVATFVGMRLEIDVFENGILEMSQFFGNEDVQDCSLEILESIIKKFA